MTLNSEKTLVMLLGEDPCHAERRSLLRKQLSVGQTAMICLFPKVEDVRLDHQSRGDVAQPVTSGLAVIRSECHIAARFARRRRVTQSTCLVAGVATPLLQDRNRTVRHEPHLSSPTAHKSSEAQGSERFRLHHQLKWEIRVLSLRPEIHFVRG